MSLEALEHALYDLGVDRARRKLFLETPDVFFAAYALGVGEVEMIRGFDVSALQAAGVNPMLTMGFWMTTAPVRDMPAYVAALAPRLEDR